MDVARPSPHRITRKSLLQVAELVIKSQIESSVHRIPDESFPDVQNFLAVLENLFYHGLRSYNFLVGKTIPKHPWCLILQLSNLPSFSHTSSVKLLDHLKSDFSKLRAWIKLSIVRCCLHSAMLDLVQLKPNLTKYYSRDAIFRSEEIFNLIDSLVGLENVQFNLDFKTELVEYSYCVPPIDFSPFLLFKQSLETKLSAICECQNENTEDRKSRCMWRHGFEKLKQNQVYSLEQLHYHEELIQKQFTQLNKYKEQLNCYEETTASLESYILELQVKLTLIHEQYDQELKRLGVNQPRLTAPTFRNIPNRFQKIHDINEKPSKISSFLNPSIKLIDDATCANATTSYQMPSILSVDQGIDALSLEDSSNPEIDSNNNHSTSTSLVEHIPSESKPYRSVKFTESNSHIKKIDQDSCVSPMDVSNRKSNSKRLPLPIKARSNSPTTTTTNSSSYPSSISESSQQKYNKSKSPLKPKNSGQTFHQKSKMLVSVQEIPSERFILPDNSYSTVSFPNNSSPKTLESMTVVVKPRSHSLFSCYVPKISTNEVEGIIRHVDSLMNPQTTMKNGTVNTITTTPTKDTTIQASNTVDGKDDIVIDDHLLECKNQCSNLVLFEAAIANIITLIMNTFIDDFLGRGLYYATNHQFYFKLDTISTFWCKSVEYISNAMYFTSSYLIVIFSIDRLLTIHKPIKFYSIYHKRWALIACILVYSMGIFSNSPLLFVQTLMVDTSSRTNFTCRMISEHPVAKFTITFETIVTFTIPFCLVLFLNVFICIQLWKLKVNRTALLPADSSRNRMEMGRVFGHLALSTAFLLLYLPMVCFVLIRLSLTLSHVDRHKPYAMCIIDLSRLFSSVKDITYAVNFFLYLIFLRNFRHRFQRLICTVSCEKVSPRPLHRPEN